MVRDQAEKAQKEAEREAQRQARRGLIMAENTVEGMLRHLREHAVIIEGNMYDDIPEGERGDQYEYLRACRDGRLQQQVATTMPLTEWYSMNDGGSGDPDPPPPSEPDRCPDASMDGEGPSMERHMESLDDLNLGSGERGKSPVDYPGVFPVVAESEENEEEFSDYELEGPAFAAWLKGFGDRNNLNDLRFSSDEEDEDRGDDHIAHISKPLVKKVSKFEVNSSSLMTLYVAVSFDKKMCGLSAMVLENLVRPPPLNKKCLQIFGGVHSYLGADHMDTLADHVVRALLRELGSTQVKEVFWVFPTRSKAVLAFRRATSEVHGQVFFSQEVGDSSPFVAQQNWGHLPEVFLQSLDHLFGYIDESRALVLHFNVPATTIFEGCLEDYLLGGHLIGIECMAVSERSLADLQIVHTDKKRLSLNGLLCKDAPTTAAKRTLKEWLKAPLLDEEVLELRQELIQRMLWSWDLTQDLVAELTNRIRPIQTRAGKLLPKWDDCRDLYFCYASLYDGHHFLHEACKSFRELRLGLLVEAHDLSDWYQAVHQVRTKIDQFLTFHAPDEDIYKPSIKSVIAQHDGSTAKYAALHQFYASQLNPVLGEDEADNPFGRTLRVTVNPGVDAALDRLRFQMDMLPSHMNAQALEDHKILRDSLHVELPYFKYFLSPTVGYIGKCVDFSCLHLLEENDGWTVLWRDSHKDEVVFQNPFTEKLTNLFGNPLEAKLLIELKIYSQMIQEVQALGPLMDKVCGLANELGALIALATCAKKYGWTRPKLQTQGNHLGAVGMKHPVMLAQFKEHHKEFVPNDFDLGEEHGRFHIFTGANLSGKTTYVEAAAMTQVLCQIGSFVACTSCEFTIVDGLHTIFRDSSGDESLEAKMNTFKNTQKSVSAASLLIMDEFGSVACELQIIANIYNEILHNFAGARVLATTHLHELLQPGQLGAWTGLTQVDMDAAEYKVIGQLPHLKTDFRHEISLEMVKDLSDLRLKCVQVIGSGHTIEYTHEVIEGIARSSQAWECAMMAGIPHDLLKDFEDFLRAEAELKELQEDPAVTQRLHEIFDQWLAEDL